MITSSVAELSRSLLARRLSSIELTGSLLDRIETANRTLNAFLTVDREGAMSQAKAADARIVPGRGVEQQRAVLGGLAEDARRI